jgi:hypothetical protein
MVGPYFGGARFEGGNPFRQLRHFKVAAFILQRRGPDPEGIGQQTPESTQRDHDESHPGWNPLRDALTGRFGNPPCVLPGQPTGDGQR